MESYNYQSLCQAIKKMPHWQCAALCAVCAEKVTPIVGAHRPTTHLATGSTVPSVRLVIDATSGERRRRSETNKGLGVHA